MYVTRQSLVLKIESYKHVSVYPKGTRKLCFIFHGIGSAADHLCLQFGSQKRGAKAGV